MEEKIKNLYKRLTNKELGGNDSIISAESFSSVLLDRFVSELTKLGIFWDKNPTTINQLITSKSGGAESQSKTFSLPDTQPALQTDDKLSVGVDIQMVDKFPTVKDPWEEPFYKESFNEVEIAHCLKKINPFESFAGIFAAKEAVSKATGIHRENIWISFSEEGKPLSKLAAISISHDGNFAAAIAVKDNLGTIIKNSQIKTNNIEPVNKIPEKETRPSNKFNSIGWISFAAIVLYIFYKEWLVFWL